MAWTQSGNIRGASGVPGASGAQGASGVPGASGASGVPGATGATGASGASGGTGGTGGIGASGPGQVRSISTVTTDTTLGASAGTDYVCFANIAITPGSDPNVVALLHGDGSNNATTITDSSALASNWTASGNAKLSTANKKFGTAAISFDSSNSYITATAASSNFEFGTSAFTVEFFAYVNSSAGVNVLYDHRPTSGQGLYPTIYVFSNTLYYFVNGGNAISGGTFSNTTWYHVALCRSGTSTRLFLDGTQVGSTLSDSNSYLNPSNRPVIGRNSYTSNEYLNGLIDEVRICKGEAKYTANFTAPSVAFSNPTPAAPGKVTLPTAAGSNTSLYTVSNIHATDSLTLATTSSQTINGSASGTLASGAKLTVVSDGSNWRSPW